MEWGFSWLLSFVNAFWDSFVGVVTWMVDGGMWVCKAAVWYVLEGFYAAILAFLATINFTNIAASTALAWSGMPSQLCYCVANSGIAAGLAVISSGWAIRLLLNLIPGVFTRV
jgi:hypothetical protein